jgi:hypothetical protein
MRLCGRSLLVYSLSLLLTRGPCRWEDVEGGVDKCRWAASENTRFEEDPNAFMRRGDNEDEFSLSYVLTEIRLMMHCINAFITAKIEVMGILRVLWVLRLDTNRARRRALTL